MSVNGGRCICRCDDGDVWPCGYEATGVPRVPVVVAVSDLPFAPQEVMVANPACGSSGGYLAGLHGRVRSCGEYDGPPAPLAGG